ncbi:probable beta-D-xylosidase 6 [Impatiens glandulifera]|uniref:probable beta-D-xylosidase 6 n=1 Tax=Impatiens glandulifera TaxID=253017 RepID=UPI001FB0D2AF|nr:probable beta-D-xylosidase 6 [Impatiens glandulifera]
MSHCKPWKWSLSFIFILSFLFTSTISTNQELQFPCKPPQHNSYPFCDTSLPIQARAESLVSFLTLEEKIKQLSDNASSILRLGIPAYEWWSESLHGIAKNGPGINFNGTISSATSFPQVILTTASFNRSLWRSIASAIAVEARAMYNVGQAGLTFWAPNVNIFRDPRWGRGQETPGEDPMVASVYAVEYVRGFQGGSVLASAHADTDKSILTSDDDDAELMLSACCKHVTAYDLEDWGSFTRYNFNAVITNQDFEDTYQPPFRSCVEQGKASCLMCSYNAVNGIPACAREDLLQRTRVEWGFKGYIASDCDAVATIYEYQKYSRSPEDAVADALGAGMDINCGTYLLRHTQSALEQGKVQEKDIDRALVNLFSVLIRLGLFDGDPKKGKFGKLGPKDVCTLKHRELALEAAKEGIVLLKNNDKFLPLAKRSISSLAIIGPLANQTELGGGYTGIPCEPRSIVDGMQRYVKKTTYASGCVDVSCATKAGFSEALSVAKESELVVIVVGLDLSQETEDHDRRSLLLPGYQTDLVNSIASVSKKPVILVLTGGGPLDVSFAKEDPRIASILWIGYPGETGGKALAEILFGDHNPGGRLPVTWYPESFTKVPMSDMNMRADTSRGYPGRTYRFYTGERVYGFGYGLSYSKFSYKLLSAPPTTLSLLSTGSTELDSFSKRARRSAYGINHVQIDDMKHYCDSLRFPFEILVTNNGEMEGGHVVMLFSGSPKVLERSGRSPEKQLIGFERIETVPYVGVKVRMMVDPCEDLSIVNEDGKRVLALGNHSLMIMQQYGEDFELRHIVSIIL